jgi:hypothetical protein
MRTSRRATRVAGALAAPLLLAGALGGLVAGPVQAATAACTFHAGAQPPNIGPFDGLDGVATLTACNAWAVGSFSKGKGVFDTLIEHWDGSKWKVIPSPNPGTHQSELFSVSAASATNIWAVGDDNNGLSNPQKSSALILHWNGTRWTQQTAPQPGVFNTLFSVHAVSGGEAWAVGESAKNKQTTPLILHFTGGKWTSVKAPPVGNASLASVTATSATDAWAVGGANFGLNIDSLVLHWNGKTWTQVPSPSPAEGSGDVDQLNSVSATSAKNAMAVGFVQRGSNSVKTFALRWDGKTWTQVPSPSVAGNTESELNGVVFTSPGSARAVGNTEGLSGLRPLIEQWNGKSWSMVKAPTTSTGLADIAASSATNSWAVGFTEGNLNEKNFALHFS